MKRRLSREARQQATLLSTQKAQLEALMREVNDERERAAQVL